MNSKAIRVRDIPHLHEPCDERQLHFPQAWYDGETHLWSLYILVEPDVVEVMPPQGSWTWVEGLYFAAKPAAPDDLEVPLLTLIVQHLSFPYIFQRFYALVDDIHHLAATLEKLEQFRTLPINERLLSFLVETEIEYLFILLRSMYDLVQQIVRGVSRINVNEQKLIKCMNNLPESFSDVLFKGGKQNLRFCTVEELSKKYRLPKKLLDFYKSECYRFFRIRHIRDEIVHYGKKLPHIYASNRGFEISTKSDDFPIWSDLEVWQQHQLRPNNIGSVRALAAFLATSFLNTLNDFEQALRSAINPNQLPPAVSAGMNVYLRNPVVCRLSKSSLASVCSTPWD